MFILALPLSAESKETNKNQSTIYLSDPDAFAWPSEKIYSEGKFLLSSGQHPVSSLNTEAVNMMLNGEYQKACRLLEIGRKKKPQFLPFRYNLGLCYYRLRYFQKSVLEFRYALLLMPRWSKIPLRLGMAQEKLGLYNDAEDSFRLSIRTNPLDLTPYIALGNLFFSRRDFYRADQYYHHALKLKKDYANALLGIGKVLFIYQRYQAAIRILKNIDINKYPDYDKSYHYYYGESLYKAQAYREAADQYEKLLSFPNADFFSTNAVELIRFKWELAKKFADAQKTD